MVRDGIPQWIRGICMGGPAVVHEEEPLSQSPKRGCAELIGTGSTLDDAVIKTAHVMQGKIREGMKRLLAQTG